MSIEFKHVSYIYAPGSPTQKKGLDDVTFSLPEKQFVALIGHTGSGKSTLMQHFNALLKPSAGEIDIAGYKIDPQTGNKHLKELRHRVSLVFQFPEAQLFEETVRKDIAFGPINFGISPEKADQLALEWLKRMGLDASLADRSPFELSGGQMRRMAIAGVMAAGPQILLLDEPAAGLDPQSRLQMMHLFKNYQKEGHTVILVTHNMDDVASYADDVLVMEKGRLIKHAAPRSVFADENWVQEHHLREPQARSFAGKLMRKGFKFDQLPLTGPELVKELAAKIGDNQHE